MESKVLDDLKTTLGEIKGGVESNATQVKTVGDKIITLDGDIQKVKSDLDNLRRSQLAQKQNRPARKGEVSEDCAAHLGALMVGFGLRAGKFDGLEQSTRENLLGAAKEILGMEVKTALSSTDIPLPTQYSGDVVELVSQYGAARRFGTVFPLGAGTVNLPRLKTDVTFTLNAISAAITEKSPQTEWVTFTAEKFGGLIRLPNEIDADSIVPMGQFIARYAARNMARSEDHNFFVGTGAATGVNGTVKGLCFSTIDNSKVVQMASTKTKYSDATLANIRAIRATVDAPAIGMGAYYMHPSFEQHLSGLNTAGDKPYQANGLNGATLDGFPIRWVDIMPAYSTSANVSKVFMLFGDASYQYLGVRPGINFASSADAAFTTDEILIRALERFTIGLMAVGSMSGLETAAS